MASKKDETEAAAAPSAPLDIAKARELASYDLTTRMAPHLDRHLLFMIYQFLQESQIYKNADLVRAQIGLLSQTDMIDFVEEKYQDIGETAPAELVERRDIVMEQLETVQQQLLPLLKVLEKEEDVRSMADMETSEKILERFDLESNSIDLLVKYARMQYESGNYNLCGELLKHYRGNLAKEAETLSSTTFTTSTWGALGCKLLTQDVEGAIEIIHKLDEFLENAKLTKREVLLQRSWLLHWSLFAIFMRADAAGDKFETLVAFFLHEKSLSIMSLSCPHLLRYVGACLILQKRLKHLMKDTVEILRLEAASYKDPITAFLLALYTDMDFDEAQQELAKCESVFQADYFLAKHWTDFQENARLLIFETYCRIHQCINIGMLASKLNMEEDEAECWIVKLIQNAKLDARIDSEKHRVVMSKAPPSVYQQVIEKTRNLSFRSTMLLSNLEKAEKTASGGTFK